MGRGSRRRAVQSGRLDGGQIRRDDEDDTYMGRDSKGSGDPARSNPCPGACLDKKEAKSSSNGQSDSRSELTLFRRSRTVENSGRSPFLNIAVEARPGHGSGIGASGAYQLARDKD